MARWNFTVVASIFSTPMWDTHFGLLPQVVAFQSGYFFVSDQIALKIPSWYVDHGNVWNVKTTSSAVSAWPFVNVALLWI